MERELLKESRQQAHRADLLRGLDSCWLVLIAFCAVHAVAAYYLSLQGLRLHLAQAQSAARDAQLRALRLQVNPHFLFLPERRFDDARRKRITRIFLHNDQTIRSPTWRQVCQARRSSSQASC